MAFLASRSRRFSSRSTASRMKSLRFSFGSRTTSMRASVPSGKRAGVCSSLILMRPTGRFVGGERISVKPCILLISPIDAKPDITYLEDISLERKTESKMSETSQLPLPSLIRASAWDAGNFSMQKGKRTKWSAKDHSAAAETQNRLVKACFLTADDKDERVAFLRFGVAEQLEKQGILHLGQTYRQFVEAFNAAI